MDDGDRHQQREHGQRDELPDRVAGPDDPLARLDGGVLGADGEGSIVALADLDDGGDQVERGLDEFDGLGVDDALAGGFDGDDAKRVVAAAQREGGDLERRVGGGELAVGVGDGAGEERVGLFVGLVLPRGRVHDGVGLIEALLHGGLELADHGQSVIDVLGIADGCDADVVAAGPPERDAVGLEVPRQVVDDLEDGALVAAGGVDRGDELAGQVERGAGLAGAFEVLSRGVGCGVSGEHFELGERRLQRLLGAGVEDQADHGSEPEADLNGDHGHSDDIAATACALVELLGVGFEAEDADAAALAGGADGREHLGFIFERLGLAAGGVGGGGPDEHAPGRGVFALIARADGEECGLSGAADLPEHGQQPREKRAIVGCLGGQLGDDPPPARGLEFGEFDHLYSSADSAAPTTGDTGASRNGAIGLLLTMRSAHSPVGLVKRTQAVRPAG